MNFEEFENKIESIKKRLAKQSPYENERWGQKEKRDVDDMMTTHYTNFGLKLQPTAVTDKEGFICYRENFRELPPLELTDAERFILKQEERISTFRGRVE